VNTISPVILKECFMLLSQNVVVFPTIRLMHSVIQESGTQKALQTEKNVGM